MLVLELYVLGATNTWCNFPFNFSISRITQVIAFVQEKSYLVLKIAFIKAHCTLISMFGAPSALPVASSHPFR